MACLNCDNTGWVCEEHPDRPWRGTSQREDACDCVKVGMPCEACNPSGGIDEPPAISPIARVTLDRNKGPRHLHGAPELVAPPFATARHSECNDARHARRRALSDRESICRRITKTRQRGSTSLPNSRRPQHPPRRRRLPPCRGSRCRLRASNVGRSDAAPLPAAQRI
jgi:hypothetical protein